MPVGLTIQQVAGKPGEVYYPLATYTYPATEPSALPPTQLVIRITACALNHRDLFIRQHLYPGTTFGVPLLADGCGIVTGSGSDAAAKAWVGKRVVIAPLVGWDADEDGPEDPRKYAILGGTKLTPKGTAVQEYIADIEDVEEAPEHLSDVEAAALPLTGLTAWRASHTKCGKHFGREKNILVTGIGGGVALMTLLLGVCQEANVFVSSGSQAKIDLAVKMGAKGGVSYKEKGWEKTLQSMLPKERPFLDAIVDGAGGDIVGSAAKLLKIGGVLAIYGMTTGPRMPFQMSAVLKNVEVKGSTMGSRREFREMVAFVKDKKLKPIISRSVKGLSNLAAVDTLFQEMKDGAQFGKLVIEVGEGVETSKL
ncbi:hypothetical protein MRB53_041645 [Persea americana]|nr:hypothetical protein MRB53_041645 [Persea americana]